MIDICCVMSFLVHGQTDKHRERDRQTDRQIDETERQGDGGY